MLTWTFADSHKHLGQKGNRAPIWAHMGPKYRIWGIFELNMAENEPRRYSNGFLYRFRCISTKFHPEPLIPGQFQTIFGFSDFWGDRIRTYFLTNIWVSREADTGMSQRGG